MFDIIRYTPGPLLSFDQLREIHFTSQQLCMVAFLIYNHFIKKENDINDIKSLLKSTVLCNKLEQNSNSNKTISSLYRDSYRVLFEQTCSK